MAACGGDDGNGASETAGGDDASGRERPAETVPPGSDPEAVEPYLGELVVQYGELVSEIVVDPSVAENPDDPLIQEFIELYVPGSESAANILEGWADAGENVSLQPYDDEGQTVTVSLVPESVETVSDDEVSFGVCTEMQHLYYGDEGDVTEFARESQWLGQGTAARVEGAWLLESLDSFSIGPGCPESAGTEDSAAGEEEGTPE